MYFIATTVPRPQLHSGVLKISWEEGQVPAVQENMAECENAFRTAIYGKTREGVPYSAFLECRRSLGSRRLKCSGFGLQHLWFCYRDREHLDEKENYANDTEDFAAGTERSTPHRARP